MKRISTILLFFIITLFFFNGCSELFKDMEYVIIENESDYTINVFVDAEFKNTVAPKITYEFGLYTNIKYTLLCRSDPHQWGPNEIILEKGEPYTWVIENPAESTATPTPETTPEPEPTPIPTPNPQANITINNNTNYEITITIADIYKGEITANDSRTYIEEIGNYILKAYAGELDGHWQENIELLEEGYIWNLEINTELYPAENCRVWDFEHFTSDQNNIDTWNYISSIKFGDAKFGMYGITRYMPGYNQSMGMLVDYEYVPYGNDFSTAVWIKVKETDLNLNWVCPPIIKIGSSGSMSISLAEQTATTFKIRLSMSTHNGTVFIFSNEQLVNEWVYIAFTYDTTDNTAYYIVNDNVYSTDSNLEIFPSHSLYDFAIYAYNTPYNQTIYTCLDELFYSDTTIDPEIFINHYNNNVPWGSEYIP